MALNTNIDKVIKSVLKFWVFPHRQDVMNCIACPLLTIFANAFSPPYSLQSHKLPFFIIHSLSLVFTILWFGVPLLIYAQPV